MIDKQICDKLDILEQWKDRIYSFSASDPSNPFFLGDFHEKKHIIVICDEFDFNDNKLDLNIFKKLLEGRSLTVNVKFSSKSIDRAINVPMIFITNCKNILEIDYHSENDNQDSNDNIFLQHDDDYFRKGLKQRLSIIIADKPVMTNNNIHNEFTNDYVEKLIRFVKESKDNTESKSIELI